MLHTCRSDISAHAGLTDWLKCYAYIDVIAHKSIAHEELRATAPLRPSADNSNFSSTVVREIWVNKGANTGLKTGVNCTVPYNSILAFTGQGEKVNFHEISGLRNCNNTIVLRLLSRPQLRRCLCCSTKLQCCVPEVSVLYPLVRTVRERRGRPDSSRRKPRISSAIARPSISVLRHYPRC